MTFEPPIRSAACVLHALPTPRALSPATLAPLLHTSSVPPFGREFQWADSDFCRIQGLIYQKAGIKLHDGKHAMVYSRLSRRLRATGHASFKAYLDSLDQHDDPEWQQFINALTTNLTAFFREPHHFEILADLLRSQPYRSWRIWCSAASSGEEPYSIAMTASEVLGSRGSFHLVASDIDTQVLASAKRGVYKHADVKGISQEHLQRHFLRGKHGSAGLVRVKPELQAHMEFRTVNLIHDLHFKEPFDIVFCRNVMIYFDATTQRQVLNHIHRVMKPGGSLFVGHAENFSDARNLFALRGKTVYERA